MFREPLTRTVQGVDLKPRKWSIVSLYLGIFFKEKAVSRQLRKCFAFRSVLSGSFQGCHKMARNGTSCPCDYFINNVNSNRLEACRIFAYSWASSPHSYSGGVPSGHTVSKAAWVSERPLCEAPTIGHMPGRTWAREGEH